MTGSDGGMKKDGSPDINSPFYIHASEHPKQMHINGTLIDNNYTDWSQEMLNFLFAKNKVGFIDGTLMKPKKTATDYMAWMHFDAMVKGWLMTAMKKEIRRSVKYANTASEIWSDLRERFRKESTPHAYELKQTLSNTHQSRISVSAYYTKLRGLWDEIESVLPAPRCTCNKCSCEMGKKRNELREKEKLYQFLMGLDVDFAVIKTQILGMNPKPTLGNTYHLVAKDERQRMISGEKKTPPKSAAFKAFKPVRRENNVSQNKNVPKYQKCLTKEQYYSFLKHFAENDVKDGNVRMANMAGKRSWDSNWVVDSGSTEHITHDETVLNNKIVCSNEEPVVIPNGDAIHKPHTRSLIGTGKCRKGLYRMGLLNGEIRAMMTNGNTWHKRLGHASEDKLVAIDFLKSITFEAKLPKRFWGKCILTATYIINRLPSKVIDDKTPFELVFNQKPDYENMRVFGCLTYHRKTDIRGDKFKEREKPGVFMGYPQGTKGYKILDIKTGKIIISRDTKFFEEKFLFKGDNLIYEEVDALDPLNKPICDEIKNYVRPTIDEVQINESTSTEEKNKNSVVNERNEFDGTDDADEHNVNPTLNENEAEDILSKTSGPPQDTTEGDEAQPDIPQPTRVKRNRSNQLI
ncbi:putative RNA-directed DNA polymerase [Tanacetum coccineum]